MMINPKSLIGHKNTFNEFKYLYENKKLPNKILITGQSGIGKNLFVNKFLNFVFNISDNNMKYNNSEILFTNVFRIKKKIDKKNIDIQQIREMIHFLNRTPFNNKERFIFIEDIENLSMNSSNSLLKSLEEPNKNLFFLLTNNLSNNVPDTIRSRCLEFKLNLNLNEIKEIVNQYFDENIYEKISSDFANNYSSPCFLINLINYIKHTNNEISTFLIEDLIYEVIENKHYINNNFIKNNLNIIIELFFYKNINKTKKFSYNIKSYFYNKISNIKKYNLDLESFFLEFEDKLLSE